MITCKIRVSIHGTDICGFPARPSDVATCSRLTDAWWGHLLVVLGTRTIITSDDASDCEED